MTADRVPGHREQRSIRAVLAWVDLYTRGLAAERRDRRREEVAADLADEAWFDDDGRGVAVEHLSRLVRGMPSDIAWRLFDARAMRPAPLGEPRAGAPSRSASVLLVVVALLSLGGLAIGVRALADLAADPGRWTGWGPYGFVVGTALVLVGSTIALPMPRLGSVLALAGWAVGLASSPWLLAFWMLVPLAVGMRLHRPVPAYDRRRRRDRDPKGWT